MTYNIIRCQDYLALTQDVQELIDQGSRPVGGAFYGDGNFYQTMILIEPEPEPDPDKPVTTEELVKMAMKNMMDDPEMPPTSTAQQ